MSDMVPGTLVQMRIQRRFAHYTIGDVIAVTMDQAQDLAARRLAQPLAIMVPVPVEPSPESPPATRSPPSLVRK
jgi:hypothetical protein